MAVKLVPDPQIHPAIDLTANLVQPNVIDIMSERCIQIGHPNLNADHRLDWDYHKTLDDLHHWIKELPSIPEGITIEWTLRDDDVRVGYIGDRIVVMRAFALPPG